MLRNVAREEEGVYKNYYCDEKLGRCENTIYARENIENSINSSATK